MTLRRIFNDYAYGDGPRTGCWWDETCDLPKTQPLAGDCRVDVAIIGGGYTGLNAAIALANQGISAAVLEANAFGWGASGRNGGFCCLGGGMLSDAELDRQFGRTARLGFRQAEKEAVAGVETFLIHHELDVDRHSKGETVLAHRPKHMEHFRRKTDAVFENYGVEAEFIEPEALPRQGIQGGPFFGAMTIPIGFALNPRKYLAGLMTEAMSLGVRLFSNSPVASLRRASGGCKLVLAQGTVNADQVIVATNGYSSENLPDWLAGRFMPGQSTVLVTRPLTRDELSQQGWTTTQMCYDSRNLLHYFRLLPDGRFLFGMRGGLLTGARAEATARARTRRDFENMFPAWQQVESTYSWSGMVSLARNRLPFVGQIPGYEGMWAAMCYHGNGVAMGSYAGGMVAGLLTGRPSETYPLVMQRPLRRFPLGGARRGLMPPLYALLKLQDWV